MTFKVLFRTLAMARVQKQEDGSAPLSLNSSVEVVDFDTKEEAEKAIQVMMNQHAYLGMENLLKPTVSGYAAGTSGFRLYD